MTDPNATPPGGLGTAPDPSAFGERIEAAGDDIPELYQIDTVEQLRAMSDRLRVRITELLSHRAMTVAQLSDELGLAHAKVHYHVRELEQVGLVRLVATREKGGILEKYYRTVARSLGISSALLRGMPADQSVATIAQYVQQVFDDALRAFALDLQAAQPGTHVNTLSDSTLYLTDDEVRPLLRQVADLLKPYEQPQGRPDERERTFVHLLYSTPPLEDEMEHIAASEPPTEPAQPNRRPVRAPIPPIPPMSPLPVRPMRPMRPPLPPEPSAPGGSPARPRRRVVVVAGIIHFSRAELEQAVASGRPLSLNVLGHIQFDGDIPADLVDRAIERFRLRGTLGASSEIRAVLKRKERPNPHEKEV